MNANTIHHTCRKEKKNYYLIRYIKIICLKPQHLFMIKHLRKL